MMFLQGEKLDSKRTRGHVRGFTMIELLVVMAIIGVLIGLLMPAVGGARRAAKRNRARAEINQLETAWKSFFNDYRFLPNGITEMDSGAVSILRGDAGTDNDRGIPYVEFRSAATVFEDPWESPYRVDLDDGNPPNTAGGDRHVSVWSVGPDGISGTEDDINSWGE